MESVCLTHGPPGSRRHIWTFAAAEFEGSSSGYTYKAVPVSIIIGYGHTACQTTWDRTISVIASGSLQKSTAQII